MFWFHLGVTGHSISRWPDGLAARCHLVMPLLCELVNMYMYMSHVAMYMWTERNKEFRILCLRALSHGTASSFELVHAGHKTVSQV